MDVLNTMGDRRMHWTAVLIIGIMVGVLATLLIIRHYLKDMWR